MTFLAARRWYGWSAGQLLLVDIGGGSLEVAAGDGEEPAVAVSLPLGAGRLTREHLDGDPPPRRQVRRLREYVADHLDGALTDLDSQPLPRRAVATSKTFTQLATLIGAAKPKAGPYERRVLHRDRLRDQIPELAKRNAPRRAKLRGVSKARAHQILAGAIVAEAVLARLGLEHVEICPWALREGVLLNRLQTMRASTVATAEVEHLAQASGLRFRALPATSA